MLCSILAAPVQTDPFIGVWEGELTHEGGFAQAYTFQLILKKEGNQYSGTSVVKVEDIFAEMEIAGEALSNQLLIIEDVSIKRFEIKDGMEWCLKSYQLVLTFDQEEEVIKGNWQGKTSFSDCIPGQLTLRRARDRA